MEATKNTAQPTETPQISTETAETVNVSVEGEKEAGTKEMPRYECPNYADYAFERGWSIENTDFDAHSGVLCMIHFDPTDEKYVCGCLWQINSDSPNYTEHRRFKTLKGAQNYGTKRMGMKLKYQTLTVHCPTTPIQPPQSPETPQTEECVGDSPETREATYADIENASKELAEQSKAMGTTSVMELPRGLEIRVKYVLTVFGADYYSYEEWRHGKCTFSIAKISVEGIAAGIAGWMNVKKHTEPCELAQTA